MPRLFILAGCNGAGKTTASYTFLPELLDCREFVNSDEFAKSLSPFDPSSASISASRYMVMRIQYLLEQMADFSIETTLATRSLVTIIKRAKSKGYKVTLIYLWLQSPELAIQRVRNRVLSGGHNIPEDVLRRRYKMGIQYLFDTYLPLCDNWIIADNTHPPFTVVAEGNLERTLIKDENKFKKIRSLIEDGQQP
ncbi:MAG: zeta toxin family protein [Bacteroidales bacterium]|nr:zeta toxin family protein [Bacteroidales bacterium]MBQ6821777.1 zeta toxin family protein [Bacteroidales bacterium]MBR0029119.1 zeta toxin family protein [Bacteroidales bacterium]MBR0082831.1 zeta toxin family protein [Bacteroidales bacterium]MBR0292664.1 zeta toxin family protein [Bacteroidales bacterium]